jgi:hypothetical protein
MFMTLVLNWQLCDLFAYAVFAIFKAKHHKANALLSWVLLYNTKHNGMIPLSEVT